MKEFNDLCRMVEQLDPIEYATVLGTESLKLLPALRAYGEDDADCAELFATFLIGAVSADGRLDEAEYAMMAPALRAFFGADFDFETAKAFVKATRKEGRELRRETDRLVDFLGTLDEDLKNDIIFVSLLICAVDGRISAKEKAYIKQLVR